MGRNWILALLVVAALSPVAAAQARRKVIIDQDAAGPGGTDMQAILSLINSPDTEVLGITVLTDRKSTRLNSSHSQISYAVFCLKKKKTAPRRFRVIAIC